MTTIPLLEAPPGIAHPRIWVEGEPGEVAVGDLWLLSWDGVGLGLAVVSARLAGYVLVWPASLPTDEAYSPAVRVPSSPLGVPVDVWPTRETGVGDALLHRRLGSLLDRRLMVSIGDAVDDGALPPLPFAPAALDADVQRSRDEAMIDHWEAVCLTQWPSLAVLASRLDPETVRALGLTPSQVGALLELDAVDAVAVVRGEVALTPDQAEVVAGYAGVRREDLMSPTRDAAVRALLDPTWKARVLALAVRRSLAEGAARDLVASEFALAARSSNTVDDRLRAVFARLLAD